MKAGKEGNPFVIVLRWWSRGRGGGFSVCVWPHVGIRGTRSCEAEETGTKSSLSNVTSFERL
jgi:hypothetical protein